MNTIEGLFECKARGKFRNDKITPIVGDRVTIQITDKVNLKGNIDKVLPRSNELIRPKVSNVEQAAIIFAANKPSVNLDLLDRFILLIEQQKIEILICINKIDIDDNNKLNEIKEIYRNSGYKIIGSSTKTGNGIEELKNNLKNKITVFAGPSGVGKSSLLNKISSNLDLKTGDISVKIERGKHTTRHAELIELNFGGYVVDSPGFTSLNITNIDADDLQYYFREFDPFIGKCKFNGCSHIHEPECAIIAQINKNISNKRYERYKIIYNELLQQRRSKYD